MTFQPSESSETPVDIDMDAILELYLAESLEGLGEMEAALMELERHRDNPELVHLLFRQAHTIKGGAATVGLADVSELAHALEDLLDQLREGTMAVSSAIVTLLLRAVDALRAAIPDAVRGAEELAPEYQTVLAALVSHRDHTVPGHPAHPTPAEPMSIVPRPDGAGVARARTLRVNVDKLDQLLDLTGEMAIMRGRARQAFESRHQDGDEPMLAALWELDRLQHELQEQVMKVRMVPLGPVFRQFARTTRDVSMSQSKLAHLVVEGEDVELDMTVVEQLRDPLTHMLRNAIDHGLELPAARQAAGKPSIGTVTLRARHDRGGVLIEIADDGAGLDRERILRRARQAGLVEDGAQLSDAEVYRLILVPGFSTAETVTELSGRGVGMDVVRRNVEALRGTLTLESRGGAGTTIGIRLPLTLAIIQGFAVGVGEETYLVPLDAVTECLRLPAEERLRDEATGLLELHDEMLPYIRLRHRFALPGRGATHESVLVVRDERGQVGLVVDALHGESQAVIKPLGKMFSNITGVSGSTILGNGRVALILDVPTLLDAARSAASRAA